MILNTQSAQISQKQDGRNVCVIMKTMLPPGYHRNGFVASHVLGHLMHCFTLLVPMNAPVVRLQIAGTNEPKIA